MVTNETKNGRKFIKMYDPETGEYLGPLVNRTHEEAHGKKPGISLSTSMMLTATMLNSVVLQYVILLKELLNSR